MYQKILEVFLNSGINFMNMEDFFGIYVWLILIISESKNLDKFSEVKKYWKHQKITSTFPISTQFFLFEIWLY